MMKEIGRAAVAAGAFAVLTSCGGSGPLGLGTKDSMTVTATKSVYNTNPPTISSSSTTYTEDHSTASPYDCDPYLYAEVHTTLNYMIIHLMVGYDQNSQTWQKDLYIYLPGDTIDDYYFNQNASATYQDGGVSYLSTVSGTSGRITVQQAGDIGSYVTGDFDVLLICSGCSVYTTMNLRGSFSVTRMW